MSSGSGSSSAAVAQAATPQTTNTRILMKGLETLKALSLDTSVNALFNEITDSRKQVGSKDAEIVNLNAKIKDLETKKETAYNEMFEANQKERNKQAGILANVTSLEATVREKDEALAAQKTTVADVKSQLQKLEQSYKDEKAKVERANKDIDGLQQTLKDKDVLIESMKAAGSNIKQALSASKQKVAELEKMNSSLAEKLQNRSARVNELEGFAAKQYEEKEEALVDKFYNIWESASKVVVLYLKDDLPAEALQNPDAWENLKSFRIPGDPKIPLPHSNSEAAKQMRVAFILAVLAREIDKHIFQPTYIFPEDSGIRKLSVNLAMQNAKKESFCRAMLLSINPDAEAKILEARIKQVIRNVGFCLSQLLPETQYNHLRRDLEDVVKSAAETWKTVQRNRDRYEPDFEPFEWDDHDSDPFPYGEGIAGASEDIDEDILIIFPRLCRIQNNKREPYTVVTALRKSQCFAAEREQKRREPSSPTIGRGQSDRPRPPRSMSLALSNGHFLGKTSLSGERSGIQSGG